jgi:hypothetical protein
MTNRITKQAVQRSEYNVPGHEWPPLNTVSEREEKERYKREKNSV